MQLGKKHTQSYVRGQGIKFSTQKRDGGTIKEMFVLRNWNTCHKNVIIILDRSAPTEIHPMLLRFVKSLLALSFTTVKERTGHKGCSKTVTIDEDNEKVCNMMIDVGHT